MFINFKQDAKSLGYVNIVKVPQKHMEYEVRSFPSREQTRRVISVRPAVYVGVESVIVSLYESTFSQVLLPSSQDI